VSSTCFEHPSVHPQKDLYTQFYDISFTHLYKHSGRWQDVLDTDCMAAWNKYHKTANTSLNEDKHLDKVIQMNQLDATMIYW